MEKRAPTTYTINDLIARRWSPRAFADRPVETEKLYALFEAARWAPSSRNEQPWSFIVAIRQEEERYEAMAACLKDGNRKWATAAPVLLLSLARLRYHRDGEPNRHAYHDLGQAVGNLIVQATDFGLFAHQMAGFHVDRARQTFSVPEAWDPVAVIAIGYPGNPEKLPDELKEREYRSRERKPFQEFVFTGSFDDPFPFESRVKRALMGD